MNLRFGALALWLALTPAGGSQAQSWIPVASDQNKAQFDLDMGSITANGGFTQAWVRETMARRAKDATSGKPYITVMMQRLEDCRAHSFALTAFVNQNEKGLVVSSQTLPQAEWRFASPPPGSVASAIQGKICDVVATRAALKPSLDLGPGTKVNWIPGAYDPATQTRFFIDEDGVVGLADNRVGVLLRADNAGARKLADGTPISVSYLAEAYDCKAKTVAMISVDSYDSGGNLVGVFAPPPEKVERQAYVAGTSPELIAKYACRPEHIKSRRSADTGGEAGAGEISTGTAWLGPKGYLVTANHVVEGATSLELAQDGKRVGHAEVVVLDPANDIAILRPTFLDGPHIAIPLSGAPALLGEHVFTLGYPAPDLLGLALKMTSGEVSALSGGDLQSNRTDDARFLQISVPVQSGNSGGPVIDRSGRAVGIVISKLNMAGEDEVAQNVNFALKIAYVRNLLAELPTIAPSRTAKPSTSTTSLVAGLKGSVFLVIASPDEKK